jgi:predicted nuclease of predicted toxin-antitoxin system
MPRLSFCTDEHVPHAFSTALTSNGFTVVDATEELGQETVDEALLEWCSREDHVLVSNDRDFVELDSQGDHAGIVIYTSQTLAPSEFVRGIRRVDRQFTETEMNGTLVWLEQWL